MGNRTRSLFHSSISGSGLLTLNPPWVQNFVSMLERWKVMKQRRPLTLLSHFLREEQHSASLIMLFFFKSGLFSSALLGYIFKKSGSYLCVILHNFPLLHTSLRLTMILPPHDFSNKIYRNSKL